MDTSADNTNLKSQYASQITADIERNTAEHERLSADLATLQQQLTVLEDNRVLLLSMRQSLGDEATGDILPENTSATGSENGSSATRKPTSLPAARKPKKKVSTTSDKPKGAESGKSRTKRTREAGPTLQDLIRDDLTQHSEPRSANEVTTALTQTLPDREIKATVVRSTLESLVAKGQVHRTKQQRAVFYSAVVPDAAAGTAEPSAATPS
ncbi:BlaI/MecI/CopY family transcriptional regulator [Streptomyces antimycoticus]